jgi:DUF218 domain
VAPWLAVAVVGGLVLAAVAWGEYAQFRVARLGLGVPQPTAPQSEAVIVLGLQEPASRPRQCSEPMAGASRCPVRRPQPGAQLTGLLRHDQELGRRIRGRADGSNMPACGVPENRVVLEERSRTTWENVSYMIPVVEDADQIKIVSNPMQRAAGTAVPASAAPDLAARLVQAQDYRPGELWPLKPLFALYALRCCGFRYVAFTRRDLAAIARQDACPLRARPDEP